LAAPVVLILDHIDAHFAGLAKQLTGICPAAFHLQSGAPIHERPAKGRAFG
jgi:hypothetical protein